MSTTDQALLTKVQYAVLEPADGGVTFPSGLWTPAEVLAYLNAQQDRLLKATAIHAGISAPVPILAGQSRFALPADWIATLGVTWIGSDGTIVSLTRSDVFETDHGKPSWVATRDTPVVYLDYAAPTLQMDLAPAPLIAGTVELIYVPQGPDMDGTGADTLVVPDEFAMPVIAYGVLANMWGKDGRGKNPTLAGYAAERFDLGVELARIIMAGYV